MENVIVILLVFVLLLSVFFAIIVRKILRELEEIRHELSLVKEVDFIKQCRVEQYCKECLMGYVHDLFFFDKFKDREKCREELKKLANYYSRFGNLPKEKAAGETYQKIFDDIRYDKVKS